MPGSRGRLTSVWAQAAFYASLSLILPAGTVGGFVIGWYLDRSLGTGPVLAIFLGVVGTAGSIVEILQVLKRAERNAGRSNDKP